MGLSTHGAYANGTLSALASAVLQHLQSSYVRYTKETSYLVDGCCKTFRWVDSTQAYCALVCLPTLNSEEDKERTISPHQNAEIPRRARLLNRPPLCEVDTNTTLLSSVDYLGHTSCKPASDFACDLVS